MSSLYFQNHEPKISLSFSDGGFEHDLQWRPRFIHLFSCSLMVSCITHSADSGVLGFPLHIISTEQEHCGGALVFILSISQHLVCKLFSRRSASKTLMLIPVSTPSHSFRRSITREPSLCVIAAVHAGCLSTAFVQMSSLLRHWT